MISRTGTQPRPGDESPGMNFRTKLLIAFTVASLAGAALFAWSATRYAQQRFDAMDRQRSDATVAQFRRDFAQRGDEVARSVQDIAEAETTVRMALDLSRPQADFSLYANDATGLAKSHHLDFLELLASDGSLISSAQWPGQTGDGSAWVAQQPAGNASAPFLARVDLPDGAELGLLALRTVSVGSSKLYLLGGRRMGGDFLRALAAPSGMRVLLYENLAPAFTPASLAGPDGAVADADRFAPLIAAASAQRGTAQQSVPGLANSAGGETFVALPLAGRQNDLLGVLLVGADQSERIVLINQIRGVAAVIALGGILFGILLSWWVSARVTRPLARLAAGVQKVAAGHLGTQVPARSRDEVGRATRAFNDMSRQLAEQRRDALQSERVAAWREVARRMAHETKERLFPLQVAVSNLRRAREQNPAPFDEAAVESLATLAAELEKLKGGVKRFGDFAKMPPPRLEPVNVNDALRAAVKQFEPQFSAIGRPHVTPELFLDDGIASISADPELLSRALESLLLRLLDTMPAGGTLTIRTSRQKGFVRIELCDTGTGLLPEECARLFTPYYAVGQAGTGMGLATVQSVVSELHGRISVESAPSEGTKFRIEFPAASAASGPTPLRVAAVSAPRTRPNALPKEEARSEPAVSPISSQS